MLPKNWGEPMGVPAIFEKQIEIELLHPASTEEVTDSGSSKGISDCQACSVHMIPGRAKTAFMLFDRI
ncbi:MAG: hypothetical protein P8X74_07870 [Reinekea sp.]